MLELKIKSGRKHIPIFDLPAAMGRQEAYREIGDQVDALIAFLDDLGGDPDLEDGGDDEPDDDAKGDQSWPEDPRRRNAMQGSYMSFYEDAEDDDIAEEDDPSGQCDEDEVNTSFDRVRYTVGSSGAGCPISDEGGGDVLDAPHDPEGYLTPAYGIDQTLGPVNGGTASQLHDLSKQLADLHQHGQHALAKGVVAKIARIKEREAATIARANDN